jgi:hypothetical protein
MILPSLLRGGHPSPFHPQESGGRAKQAQPGGFGDKKRDARNE